MAISTLKKAIPGDNRGRRPDVGAAAADDGGKRGWNELDYQSFFQHRIGRPLQIIVRIAAVVGMVSTIMNLTLEYNESPTLTTIESDSYPARDVDFPGIAVCSSNRMSLSAVNDFAEELFSLETTKIFNVSQSEIRDMLKYLGHLYVFDVDEGEIEEAQFLHAILSRAYGDYSIDSLMMQLTPKCRSILRYCSWEGKDRVCDNMFFLRKTQDGFCCTFNYARRSDGFGSSSTKRSGFVASMVERSTLVNPEYGLSVILNSRIDDYYYKSMPSNGFKILIYSSLDYPDAPSGSLKQVFVPPKSQVFVSMDATSLHSAPEVMEYDVSARNCLFNTEQNKIFKGYYSYSDCIIYCRIRDILRLCKCVPFFYPRLDDFDSPKSCNLDDLPCLKEFTTKWRQIHPRLKKKSNIDESEIKKDPSMYLQCDCFPSCDDVEYKVSSSRIPLTIDKILWDRSIISNRNYSMLHVYFDGPNTIRLKQDVLFYWYELMSDYGGICNLFLGISIINVVEIIYFLLRLICSRRRGTVIDRAEEDSVSVTAVQDADVPAVTIQAKRLNTVKVIDIDEAPPMPLRRLSIEETQLYWQEFVKPINKVSLDK
ncbi:hypothetical protein TSAR_015195 [Trichomalopsis sarcophagae]|uniref:Sodium channel protein Nach n=1 Tax=Trichomalopsis sarcophagae TaxID=543379 RepID=A0A232EPH8_9HYME|nr:hypothetical protein TSAR_015195 [Trichomalopsis sarcophagae]